MSGQPGNVSPAAVPAEPPTPDVTVVIASVNGLPYPLACLDGLARQEGAPAFEVIVADCTGPSTAAAVRERHPDVRVLRYDDQKSVPWLRSAGIAAAQGRLVAVTEDHCVPRPDWVASLVAAHRRTGWAAVGGGVENGAVRRTVDWAAYFCEYSQLMSPVDAGPNDAVPGMNVAYDMEALAPVRHLFDEGAWEHSLHQGLRDAGYQTGLDPSIVVSHEKHFTVAMFMRERWHYSRAFAGQRVAGLPPSRRLAWAAGSLLLPPVLLARVAANVSRRGHRGRLARALPLMLLFSTVWAAGETVGYLAGPGDSMVRIR